MTDPNLKRWMYYSKWAVMIQAKMVKSHNSFPKFAGDVKCWKGVPFIYQEKGKVTLKCRFCKAEAELEIEKSKEFLWFTIPSAWCEAWNYYLMALVQLDERAKATDLEITVRALDEVVYNLLKPDYDKRVMDKDQ